MSNDDVACCDVGDVGGDACGELMMVMLGVVVVVGVGVGDMF